MKVHRQQCFPYLVVENDIWKGFHELHPSCMSLIQLVGPSNASTTRGQCESQIPWAKDNVAKFPSPEPMHTTLCHKQGIRAALLSFSLKYAMGRPSCIRTTPIPKPKASHSTSNFFEKLGKASKGA